MEPSSNAKTTSNGPSWLRILVFLLIAAGLALTAIFGIRLVHAAQRLHRARPIPQLTDVTLISNWMTIPYISRAYRVPESLLWQGLGIPETGNRHKSLSALDRQYAQNQPGAILNKVEAIVSQYEAEHPASPAPPIFPPPRSAPPRP